MDKAISSHILFPAKGMCHHITANYMIYLGGNINLFNEFEYAMDPWV
jgi:hypothetical protein